MEGKFTCMTFFQTSKRPEYRAVGDAIIEFNKTDPSVFDKDVNVHIARVRKGNYAWIGKSF